MTNKQLLGFTAIALITVAACGRSGSDAPAAKAGTSEPAAADLRSLLANESRPESDRVRDAGRKPADVIEFLGIEPGMRVMDVFAAGGYYTEVLSLAVGPHGQVVAQNPPGLLERRDGAMEKEISARLADDRLPNVSRINADLGELPADAGSFDAAITALNFHDIYNRNGPEAAVGALKAIYAVLKPGGVLGIIDHVGMAGADNVALHRIEKEKAIASAIAAGFEVAEESTLLGNTTDDHTQGVFSEDVRGHTDRFALKLRKPAG